MCCLFSSPIIGRATDTILHGRSSSSLRMDWRAHEDPHLPSDGERCRHQRDDPGMLCMMGMGARLRLRSSKIQRIIYRIMMSTSHTLTVCTLPPPPVPPNFIPISVQYERAALRYHRRCHHRYPAPPCSWRRSNSSKRKRTDPSRTRRGFRYAGVRQPHSRRTWDNWGGQTLIASYLFICNFLCSLHSWHSPKKSFARTHTLQRDGTWQIYYGHADNAGATTGQGNKFHTGLISIFRSFLAFALSDLWHFRHCPQTVFNAHGVNPGML